MLVVKALEWGRGHGRGSSTQRSYLKFIPTAAKPISERVEGFTLWDAFKPIREPGPHLPEPTSADQQYSPLSCFVVMDNLLGHLVQAQKAYRDTETQESSYVHALNQVRAFQGRDVSVPWSLPLAKFKLH